MKLFSFVLTALAAWSAPIPAQDPPEPPPPSLKTIVVPPVEGLEKFVVDRELAIVLGKALFWDMQAGSDAQACASCHFHAGADNRFRNQLSPSLNHLNPDENSVFDRTTTGGGGPNYTLRRRDFPLHRLADPDDRESPVLADLDDVVSSAGVFRADFISHLNPFISLFDLCYPVIDPLFTIGLNTRRVEPRNTPTVINAAFNFRNFWDGRANNVFNGVDPFGRRNRDAFVLEWNGRSLSRRRVDLPNSSLASQAVGPPLSDFEMSCAGRLFPDIGMKLVDRRPLRFQRVAVDDSILAHFRHPSGIGLNTTYRRLIQRAFREEWWGAPASDSLDGMSQIEFNFSLFWGLAIQLYESTLISDNAPYDRFAEGKVNAITESQKRGLALFLDKGKCINCHKGPDFTGAGFALQAEHQEGGLVERMRMGNGQIALYDNGFYNIGVRPTVEDIGVGGEDPFGYPLSFTRQWLELLRDGQDPPDPFEVDPGTFEEQVPLPNNPTLEDLRRAFGKNRDAADGAFKTPGLRNVELTGPYFHNGGQATLHEVVAFYNRGGDRRSAADDVNGRARDTTGFGHNPSNLDADIVPLGLTRQEQRDLVSFLKSLTDERVRWEMAPFDHPQLFVPNGHFNFPNWLFPSAPFAADNFIHVPAVGKGGRRPLGLGPLQPFHTQLR